MASISITDASFDDDGMGQISAKVTTTVQINSQTEEINGNPKVTIKDSSQSVIVQDEELQQMGNDWKATGLGPGMFSSGQQYTFEVTLNFKTLGSTGDSTSATP